MTLGRTGGIRAKSFVILAEDLADVRGAKISAPAATRSVYHERCFVVNDDLNFLRHSIASAFQPPAIRRNPHGRDVRLDFLRRVSRALKSIKSESTATTKAVERANRETLMEKPMFVTTVRSGVFLEPPPEVAALLGLRKNSSDERLSSRKLQPAVKGTDVVYSFASKPRIVGSTFEPPISPNGPAVANRKRIFKRQVDDHTNRNGGTMTSAGAAMDGSIQFGGGNTMHDRRVARGSNFASLRFNVPTTENPLSRQAEARRRAAVRQRAQIRARKLRSRTPPPVDGRKHGEIQTEKYLEELNDKEMNTSAIGCQADLLSIDDDEEDRFTSSVSNMTTPRIDAQTQLEENDLIFPSHGIDNYDEVRGNTIIVSTVNKILKEAILEINAEIEKFQNTKEIITTRLSEPEMSKKNTIVFTRHELYSLLRNFNAQNKHSDWPILDFEEKSYNSLVDNVFDHIRMILTNLDFLANITRKQLEFHQTKLSKKSDSPSSSTPETLEIAKSTEAVNETIIIPDNNVHVKVEERHNSTAAQEAEESMMKVNEREMPSDLLSTSSDEKETQEKLSSDTNKIDVIDVASDSIEINTEPVKNENQHSSAINDEKKSNEKAEIDTVTELRGPNPPSIKGQTMTNIGSTEMKTDAENKHVEPSGEEISAEENPALKNLADNEDINDKTTRANDLEVQAMQNSLNEEEIHSKSEPANTSNNSKSLADQDDVIRSSNKTSETALRVDQLESDETSVNEKDARAQDIQSKMESNSNGVDDQMNNEKYQSSEVKQEQSKQEIENKLEGNLQSGQKGPQNSEDEKSNDIVNDKVTSYTGEISGNIDINNEIVSVDNSESTQVEIQISTNPVENDTIRAKNNEEQNSLQELNEKKIEEITTLPTEIEKNAAEKRKNRLQLVDASPIPEITIEHSEKDDLNEPVTETNEQNRNIPQGSSDTQFSENNPSNGEANKGVDSEIDQSNQHSVDENTTSSSNHDSDIQGSKQFLEKQVEPSIATNDLDETSNNQIKTNRESADDTTVDKVEETSKNLQNKKDIVTGDSGSNAGDESNDDNLQMENKNTQNNIPVQDAEVNLNQEKRNNKNDVPNLDDSKLGSSNENEKKAELDMQNLTQSG